MSESGEELRLHLLGGLARDLTEQAGWVTTLLAIGSTEFSHRPLCQLAYPAKDWLDGWMAGGGLEPPRHRAPRSSDPDAELAPTPSIEGASSWGNDRPEHEIQDRRALIVLVDFGALASSRAILTASRNCLTRLAIALFVACGIAPDDLTDVNVPITSLT